MVRTADPTIVRLAGRPNRRLSATAGETPAATAVVKDRSLTLDNASRRKGQAVAVRFKRPRSRDRPLTLDNASRHKGQAVDGRWVMR